MAGVTSYTCGVLAHRLALCSGSSGNNPHCPAAADACIDLDMVCFGAGACVKWVHTVGLKPKHDTITGLIIVQQRYGMFDFFVEGELELLRAAQRLRMCDYQSNGSTRVICSGLTSREFRGGQGLTAQRSHHSIQV